MTSLMVVLCSTCTVAVVPEEWNGDQFIRLMDGLHSELRDITLVYEGEIRDHSKEESSGTLYQGLYSFRHDGATLLDLFTRARDNAVPGGRTITAVLHGELEELKLIPDRGYSNLRTGRGSPGVVGGPLSAERILHYSFFSTLDQRKRFHFQDLGWKRMHGHRCRCVRISTARDPDSADASAYKLWIDLERGGHPLRVEYLEGDNVAYRTEITELAQVSLEDGERLWLPMAGQTESYLGLSQEPPVKKVYHRRPLFTETYIVVPASIRVNQGLEDDYFTAKRETVEFEDERLARLQRALNAVEPKERPVYRTDPESVRKRLEEHLADAERQATLLEASSAARESRVRTPVYQFTLIGMGTAVVLGALYWKWRYR